jgi:hypothetical protein
MVLARAYSVPERITLFGLGCAAIAAVYPILTDRTGLGLPCPLRTLTGIPCPFCGLTTATVALVSGDPAGAAAANPLVFLLAALVIATVPVLLFRFAGRGAEPRPWSVVARRRTGWVVGGLAALSWVFQLHRYDLL